MPEPWVASRETWHAFKTRVTREALEEFVAPLADIAAQFRYDGEQARKRGLNLLAADLFRFAKSVQDVETRSRWALAEFNHPQDVQVMEGGSVTFADGVTAFVRGVRLTVKEG